MTKTAKAGFQVSEQAILLAFIAMLSLHFATSQIFAAEQTAKPTNGFTVRLVNITIPPDSRLRNLARINNPPLLYLVLYEDGVLIGKSSTVVEGWEVDFPDISQNRWPLKAEPKTRYAVKVMDDQWWSDDVVLEITGRKATDLRGVVRERGAVSESADRLATVEFEVLTADESETAKAASQTPPPQSGK